MAQIIDDLLTHRKKPIAVGTETSVREAVEAMNGDSAGSVLVMDPLGELAGIFTERDVLTRVLEEGRDAERTMVAEVMTPMPITIGRHTSIDDALARMREHGVCHLPVVEGDEVIGIIALRDLASVMTQKLADENRALRGYIHGPHARGTDSHF
jgi:CBS domain-containing protein